MISYKKLLAQPNIEIKDAKFVLKVSRITLKEGLSFV